jgi:hypothetical protein
MLHPCTDGTLPVPGWSGRAPFRVARANNRQGRGGLRFPVTSVLLDLFKMDSYSRYVNFELWHICSFVLRGFTPDWAVILVEHRELGSCSGWVLGASPFVITRPLLVRLKGVLLLGLGGVPYSRRGEGLRDQCTSALVIRRAVKLFCFNHTWGCLFELS